MQCDTEEKPLSLGVIIVNYNSGDLLVSCLEALSMQKAVPQKIIVVDNASEDDSMSRLPEYENVVFLKLQDNLGFAAANNLALQHLASMDLVMTLNPDAFVREGCLEALIKSASEYPDHDSFACRMMSSDYILDGAGDNYHISGLVWRNLHGSELNDDALISKEVFSPCAGAAMYRRNIFDEIGGFDESFFCYVEDIDLGYRLRLVGKRCRYIPDAVVEHIGSAITSKYPGFSVYHGHRNLVWAFIKNTPMPIFIFMLPIHILMTIFMFFFFLMKGQAHIYARAKLDALSGLPEIFKKRKLIQRQRCISAWQLLKSYRYGFSRS